MALGERTYTAIFVILGAILVLGVGGSVVHLSTQYVRADQARALREIDRSAARLLDGLSTDPPAASEQAYREAVHRREGELTSFSARDGRVEFTVLFHRTAASGGEKLQHFRRCFSYTLPGAGPPSYVPVECPDIRLRESWKYVG